jgi:diguanylate cyclase (GGDEF)-like protein
MSIEQTTTLRPPPNERRYAERIPTRQTAVIIIAGLGQIACAIRDYCSGGLYLRLQEPSSISLLRRLDKTEPVTVQFPYIPGQDPSYTCNAMVAHIEADGLGVAFTVPPKREAFELLQQTSLPAKTASAPKPPADSRESMLDACTKIFQESLSQLVTHFQNSYEPALQDTADKSDNFRIKRDNYDAITLLKQNFDRLRGEFLRQVAANSTSMLEKGVDKYGDSPVEGELSLVDQEQFEDWLNITNEITRTEDRFESLLRDFNQRYSALTGMSPDNRFNPYAPGIIGHAFRHAVGRLNLSNVAKRELYAVFGHSMRSQLAPLYRKLEERLAEVALPKHEPKIRHTHMPEGQQRAEQAGGTEIHSLSRLLKLIQDNLEPTPAQTPRGESGEAGAYPQGPASPGAEAWASPGGGRPAGTPSPIGGGMAAEMWAPAGNRAMESPTGTAPPAMHQAHVAGPGFAGAPTGRQGIPASLFHLSPTEMLAMEGVRVGEMSDAQRQVIEAAGNLVRTTLSVAQFPEGVRQYADRLQVPMLKLSLTDPSVIDTESHPARRLFDGIDMLSLAANERGELAETGLRQKLDELVERVVQQADQGPTVFHVAQTAMDRLVEPYAKLRLGRIVRVQQAAEGKQRVKDAIQAANRELKSRLSGQRVPRLLVDLVAKGWRHYLILTALRHGETSDEWAKAVNVLDEVLVYIGIEAADAQQAGYRRLLLQRIGDGLAQVNTDLEDQERFLETLKDHLLGSVEETPPCPQVRVADSYLAEKTAEAALSPEMDARLRNLQVGEWLRFNEDDDTQVNLQLVWVAENADRFVFVNRQGVKKLELDRQGMAERLAKAEARRSDNLDTPLSIRSEDAMVQQVQDVLVERVSHDPVTGLINRREFLRQLCQYMPGMQQGDKTAVMGMLEIDQLRAINDTCGLEAGEQLIQELAKKLTETLDSENVLARAGDSSFAFCLMDNSKEQGLQTAETLRASIEKYHFRWENMSYTIGASIGMTFCDESETSAESALRKADAACLRASEKGRNFIEFYEETDADMQSQQRLMEWAGRIDQVLQQNRLFIRCQRILPLDPFSRMEQQFEILLGVRDEEGESVSVEEFFTAVEHWRRAVDIDRWVLTNLFPWLRANKDKFNWSGGFSINLSGQTLSNQTTLDYLTDELNQADLPRERIIFEITETAAIDNIGLAENFIRKIKRYGCRFALDEFGSGYCSYSYLKNLNVDFIKISGDFVQGIASNPSDFAMVRSMNEIAHSLGIKTVAKNVINQDIMNALQDIGLDYAQGYKVGNPILLSDLA